METATAPPQITPTQQDFVAKLQEFALNLDDIANPANAHMTQDHQNKLALDAQAGWSTGTHTTIAQQDKRKLEALEAKSISGARAMASVVNQSFSQSLNFNINLSGVTLNDSHMVDISENNTLMVRGDGPESEFREATLDELVQIETESMACSIAVTQQEIDMNAYLNGETDALPDSLHALAEENGLLADDLSREDFAQLVEQRYATNPHIVSRITGEIRPGGLNSEMGLEALLPEREGLPAAETGFQSTGLNEMFGLAANPAPAMTPIPAPAPQMTPALTPSPSL